MEKLLQAIQNLAPILIHYPRWAQWLFITTAALLASSAFVLLVYYPIVTAGAKKDGAFDIIRPRPGDYISIRRLAISGQGADPAEYNVLRIKATNLKSGSSTPIDGELSVSSDGSWRFDSLMELDPGQYSLEFEATFGSRRYSKTMNINYEPDRSSTELRNREQQGEPQPTVAITGPDTALIGRKTYYTILSTGAVRGVWSVGGFQNQPVTVEPLGRSHQIYIEPKDPTRVKTKRRLLLSNHKTSNSSKTNATRHSICRSPQSPQEREQMEPLALSTDFP
jgi:hypothetical protein